MRLLPQYNRNHSLLLFTASFVLCASSQAAMIVSNVSDGTIKTYDQTSGAYQATIVSSGRQFSGVAVDGGGDIWVVQYGFNSNSLAEYNQAGTLLRQVASPNGDLLGELAIGPDGYLYATDFAANQIDKFDITNNAYVSAFGASYFPHITGETFIRGVAFTPNGSLVTINNSTYAVEEFNPTTGAHIATLDAGYLTQGDSLAVSAAGNIYVGDFYGGLTEYDSSGTKIQSATVGVSGFDPITGVAFGPDGSLYVADSWNAKGILKVNPQTLAETAFAQPGTEVAGLAWSSTGESAGAPEPSTFLLFGGAAALLRRRLGRRA